MLIVDGLFFKNEIKEIIFNLRTKIFRHSYTRENEKPRPLNCAIPL